MTKSIEIEASPEKVFALIIDWKKMNKALKGGLEGEYTSKGSVGVGSTAHIVGKVGNTQAEMDMEITEFVKNKKRRVTKTPSLKSSPLYILCIYRVHFGSIIEERRKI